jgi:hypothetical protein
MEQSVGERQHVRRGDTRSLSLDGECEHRDQSQRRTLKVPTRASLVLRLTLLVIRMQSIRMFTSPLVWKIFECFSRFCARLDTRHLYENPLARMHVQSAQCASKQPASRAACSTADAFAGGVQRLTQ